MTSRRLRHLLTCGLVLALLSAMSACTGNTLAGKVGVLGPERVLVLANASIPGLEVPPAITEFVTAIRKRSHGRLRVEVHTGLSDIEEEGRVVAEVAAGRTDLGWAEAHTLEAMGAASLRPLFVPLLVDSYPLQAALLSRYTIPLLADVSPTTGVTPLALFAGALRFAASTDHPLLTAADWTGRVFWTSTHGQEEAGIRALGATPVVDPRDRQTLIQAGLIDSAETTWRAYPASLRFVAPNVRLWPRAVVLLASPGMLRTLTPQQRGWLDGASGDAATWTLTHAGDADAARLKDACRNGTRAALANPAELAAMRTLGQQTLRQAQMPAWTGDLAREVERLRQQPAFEPPVDIPGGCQYAPADAMQRTAVRRAPLTGPGRIGALAPGTYRYALTRADIEQASNGGANGDYLSENVGRWTWTIGAGRWSVDMRPTDSTFPAYPCAGWFSVSTNLVTFTRTVNGLPGGDCVPLVWSARFRVDGEDIHWSETDIADFGWVFQSTTWHRIG